MEDYRALKKYEIDEWENNNWWKAKRLDFIWCMRDYKSQLYLSLGLHDEKEDFYSINNAEVALLASELHYSVDVEYYKKTIGKKKIQEQFSIFNKLRELKDNDIIEFMRKDNCNLYEYLKMKEADGYFEEYKIEVH